MVEKWLNLTEAARFLGVSKERIKTAARRHNIPFQQEAGGRRSLLFLPEDLTAWHQGSETRSVNQLWAQYLEELKYGTISKAPVSERYLLDNQEYWGRYWRILDREPSLRWVSAEGFRQVMQSIPIDDESKRDGYSTRMHYYRLVNGFMRLLVREGIKTPSEKTAVEGMKPRRKYKPNPVHLMPEEAEESIGKNLCWEYGRTSHDVQVMDTLIRLYYYGGLRKMEAAWLTVGSVDLGKRRLNVWGKGGKQRIIPLHSELSGPLEWWIDSRGKDEPLILMNSGEPITESSIRNRFKRFNKYMGDKCNPHAYRRACAARLAILENRPLPMVQRFLGHSSIETTMGYIKPFYEYFAAWEE